MLLSLCKPRNVKKRSVYSTLLFVATCVTVYAILFSDAAVHIKVWFYNDIKCYRFRGERMLPDISTSPPPKDGKSIFFHETSCKSHKSGKIVLTPRQACAVESAAKMNPNYTVHLLFTGPGDIEGGNSESDRIIRKLKSYPNIKILHLDFSEYVKGSPVENIYQNGYVEASMFSMSHASDVLRYLTLWKYGGIYMDLDVVVVKSLQDISPNFAGRESNRSVAAGVIGLESTGIGHVWAEQCLQDLSKNFDGQDWGHNGPGVITRLLQSICGTEDVKEMNYRKCQGFNVFSEWAFYPIPWKKWNQYFDNKYADQLKMDTRTSYCIHVWNKFSFDTPVAIGDNAFYEITAKKFCPRVYGELSHKF